MRRELQRLPGGPDEGPRILQLQAEVSEGEAAAGELTSRIVPRPTPSQYLALRQELAQFTAGLGSPQRVKTLVIGLKVSS